MTYPGSRSHTWVAGEQVDHDDLNEWGPPNVGWGLAAPPALYTTDNSPSGISSVTDIGVSVTFTAVASRTYKVTLVTNAEKSGSATSHQAIAIITDGSNNTLNLAANSDNEGTAGQYWTYTAVVFITPGAGSVTVKGRFQRTLGALNTYKIRAASTVPTILAVEDVGPSTP